MNKPLVSVLIPVYGVEKYILKCFDSVLNQTYNNIEVVFVNDCTPDNSIKLVKCLIEQTNIQYPVRIVEHEVNKGLAAARNTAVKNAVGELILHLDADDTIAPNTIEKTVDKMIATGADAVMYGMLHEYKDYSVSESIKIPSDITTYIQMMIERKVSVCMCGGLYKRTLYTDNNIMEIEGCDYEEDYVTKPRLLYYAKKVVALNEPLYIYNHINERSLSSNFNNRCILDTIVTMNTLNHFFRNVIDSQKYEKSLNVAAQKEKANLLTIWSLKEGDMDSWLQIDSLFPETYLTLSVGVKDYVSLLLSLMKMPRLMRAYIVNGFKMKQVFKRIKS